MTVKVSDVILYRSEQKMEFRLEYTEDDEEFGVPIKPIVLNVYSVPMYHVPERHYEMLKIIYADAMETGHENEFDGFLFWYMQKPNEIFENWISSSFGRVAWCHAEFNKSHYEDLGVILFCNNKVVWGQSFLYTKVFLDRLDDPTYKESTNEDI